MMKDKILVFVIGLLVGAILASGGFLIYEKNNSVDTQNQSNNQVMERPEGGMPNGQRPDGETPPEKPDGEDDGTRPEPPSKNNNSSSDKTNKKDSTNSSKNSNQ